MGNDKQGLLHAHFLKHIQDFIEDLFIGLWQIFGFEIVPFHPFDFMMVYGLYGTFEVFYLVEQK